VPTGQLEAARALGLTERQTLVLVRGAAKNVLKKGGVAK